LAIRSHLFANLHTPYQIRCSHYVLKHREDDEALRALIGHRDPNAIKYNLLSTH